MAPNNAVKTRYLPLPVEATQLYDVTEQAWKVLTEVTFPLAKTPEAIMMALDYCRARKLDIFKKPVHIVPMWSAALGRSVETVWPSIMEIQTTAARTGLWAGIDRPVWGPDKTQIFSGRYKDDFEQWQETSVEVTFPEWVAVTVYRVVNGQRCAFTEEVYWLEAYSTAGGRYSQVPSAMWLKRPKGQLAKCGKAASLRAAFPEDCGYAAEEMEDKALDIDHEPALVNDTALQNQHPPITSNVQKAVAELVRRTALAGAWQDDTVAMPKPPETSVNSEVPATSEASAATPSKPLGKVKPAKAKLPLSQAETALSTAREALTVTQH